MPKAPGANVSGHRSNRFLDRNVRVPFASCASRGFAESYRTATEAPVTSAPAEPASTASTESTESLPGPGR